jgi:hypothetical protein
MTSGGEACGGDEACGGSSQVDAAVVRAMEGRDVKGRCGRWVPSSPVAGWTRDQPRHSDRPGIFWSSDTSANSGTDVIWNPMTTYCV